MATTSERDIFEAIALARGNEEYGAAAEAMATLELSRQQRAANMLHLAECLKARGPSEFEEKIIRSLLHAAADITGLRPDGSVRS